MGGCGNPHGAIIRGYQKALALGFNRCPLGEIISQ